MMAIKKYIVLILFLVTFSYQSYGNMKWQCITKDAGIKRIKHRAIEYDNKLWIVCGFGPGEGEQGYTDVISSSDKGKTWQTVLDKVPFFARAWFDLIVFKDYLWLVGGCSDC